MKIYYLVTDNPKPSWGVGIIYHHVSLLVEHGYDAAVVHNVPGFNLNWLDLDVPVLYFNQVQFNSDDCLVVPEVMGASYNYKKISCKKILFVQNLSYLFFGFTYERTYLSQGFSRSIVIMPHMKKVVQQYTGLPVDLIPPFVSDYFFKEQRSLSNRKKTLLIYPKSELQEYSLVIHILLSSGYIYADNFINRNLTNCWRLLEMKGHSHVETSELMKGATFLITTNTFEAFNTSVPEAMASGCINVCYEAVGPADYLVDGENAFVFQNNQAIALAEKVVELIENYDHCEENLARMRLNAYKTASEYSKENMQTQLLDYFSSLK